MAIKSKYNSKCKRCGNFIRKDIDWIEPQDVPGYDKPQWVHVQCPPALGMSALGTSVKTQSNYKNAPQQIEPDETLQNIPVVGSKTDALIDAIEQSLTAIDSEPIVEKTFIPSVYQQAIFDAIKAMVDGVAEFKHLVIEAVAGSGKTTTIEQSLKLISSHFSVAFLAFNKHIADELARRCQRAGLDNVFPATLHKLGLKNFKKAFPKFNAFRDIEDDKVGLLLESVYPVTQKVLTQKALEQKIVNEDDVKAYIKACRKQNYPRRDGMRKIVSMAKNTLIDFTMPELVKAMIDRYNMDIEEKYIDELVARLPEVMEMCKARVDKIDYNDMIWLPIVLNLDLEKFDFLMVDEAQDMNALQIEFINRSVKADGHIIAVGDRYQSLYAFRGADADAIPNIIKALDAKVLPLSVTYRCPASHVRKAQALVPHLEPRDNAPEGTLIETDSDNAIDYMDLVKHLQPGDMVICRTNGPLVKPAFECIRRGIKAVIRGKDIGSTLVNLIKRFETNDIGQFEISLAEYYEHESTKLINAGKEMKALALQDRVDTLRFILNECASVRELEAKIDMLFSDKNTGVIFSSVHKAKGLEADRVYILRPDLMPHPRAKKDWERQQELNCQYVAETRSKDTLVLVKGGESV